MNEKQALIDSIKRTLETLTIEATENNLGALMACHQALLQLREEVADNAGGNAAAAERNANPE